MGFGLQTHGVATSAQIRQQLVDALHSDLIGPGWDDTTRRHERLSQPPSVWYTTGFLVPHVLQQEARRTTKEHINFDELGGEDPSNDAANRLERNDIDDDANDTPDQANIRRSWFPSSLGLSFILDAGSTIQATVTWGDYTPAAEDEESKEWVRTPQRTQCSFTVDGHGVSEDYPLEQGRPAGLCLRWIAQRAPRTLGYSDNQLSVSLFLLNKRKPPESQQVRCRDLLTAFQAELSINCQQGFPRRRDALRSPDHQDPDEALAALQYRHDFSFASGHNVAVKTSDIPQDKNTPRVHTLTTTWLPTAQVWRVLPEPSTEEVRRVPMDMETLARLDQGKQIVAQLEPMVKAYRNWIDHQPTHPPKDLALQGTADKLRQQALHCADRIDAGIQLLNDDPLVREAFRTMNLVMARSQRQRRAFRGSVAPHKSEPPRWRFFQLAFVLMNLPGLATPDSEHGRQDRAAVELLFFPTGGGKTEAYLGLAAFTLVHRRLSHPGIASAGVTVLMRYTLRLLTMDQLGRAATVICALELERLERAKTDHDHQLGGWPFEIGMWVGKNATPNKLGGPSDGDKKSAHAVLSKWKNGGGDRPIPIETCPWCNRPLQPSGFHLLPPNRPDRLEIYCREPSRQEERKAFDHMGPCPFRQGTALPVLPVDEQIYRRLPCFLLSTIDKFAALPWLGKTSTLFGNVSHYQLPNGSGVAGFWGPTESVMGRKIPQGRLLPPVLVIQDELHLISGPLGTMAGLYESVIEKLMRPSPETPPPKIIASTATVRCADAQIKALFARHQVRLFPPPGPDREDNFFSHTVRDPNQARLYVGLSAPGRNLKGVLLQTCLGLMAAAQKAWNQHKGKGVNNPADPYMTLLGYFSNLKELGVTRSILENELGAQLEQFASNRALPMEGVEHPFACRKRPREPEELTSRVDTAKISATKDRLAKFYVDKDHLDVALATNMISVGLDISRLGLMVVLNQPKTAAEYIQATSRVGRQLSGDDPERNKPGLVLVLFSPNRPRDRSHYELFPYWHQTFYRHVEATSCTPFASRALDRGLPGVVVAMARHSDPSLVPPQGAMAAEVLQDSQTGIARTLEERCRATGAADNSPDQKLLPTEVRDHALDLMEAWWKLTQQDESTLQYWTHEEKGAGIGFLHTPLDSDPIYQTRNYSRFTTNWSLRDVEPAVPIRLVNFQEDFTDAD